MTNTFGSKWRNLQPGLHDIFEYSLVPTRISNFRLKLVYDIEGDVSFRFLDVISEPSNQACSMAYSDTIREINTDAYRSGETSLVLLDEDYMTFPLVLLFRDYSPYLETYNEMLGWMESNGLMEQWREKYFKYSSVRKSEDIGPQVLTMDHLKLGFLACLIPINFCVAAFIGEVLLPKVANAIRKYVYKAIMKKRILLLDALRGSMQDFFHFGTLTTFWTATLPECRIEIEDLEN